MQRNDLLQNDGTIYRVLDVTEERILVIDCIKRTMPQWIDAATMTQYQPATEAVLLERSQVELFDIDALDAESKKIVHERFTMVAGVLPFIADDRLRTYAINRIAADRNVSKQTIRNYLCLYLAYQNISTLAPKRTTSDKPLTKDEKNIRWALNKFFYTQNKNSLNTAYTYMLKERYTDGLGNLFSEHPTFNQFRYFYRKHRKMQTYYISRNGLKDYQRNNRPLIGNGVQEFAPAIGVGMLDSTICDIYLVDDAHNLVGRPILTACVDAFSGLCCGYSLSWEGGVYSLRGLVTNIISDKAICKQDYNGILGGADSFTVIGSSGIGKSSAINRAIDQIIATGIIETKEPYSRIIPCIVVQCPFDSSVKGLLLEILRKVDECLNSQYYENALRVRATTDMLIGNVSQVALNHIGLLVVDEIQNVCNSRHGKSLVGMLTQLINNSGISICMVGTPESAVFFEQAMQLARRSLGLQYKAIEYNAYFRDFCRTLFSIAMSNMMRC